MKRSTFNWIGGSAASILGLWTLCQAVHPESQFPMQNHAALGYLLIGFWALAPPVFFWIDWVFFCQGLPKAELEIAQHTHDLSRNIWLALLAILAVAFGVKLAGG